MARGERLDHYQTVHVTRAGKQIGVSLSVSPIVHAGTEKVTGVSMIARNMSKHETQPA